MGFGVGDLLAGKYRVERIIGRGGMGVVLAARHVDLGALFAVKLVEGVDRSGGERLLREARASARLRGEHVVRLHDVGWLAEKTPFLVLELVRGESIAAELRARGPFSAEDTAVVLLHATLALAEAHASALVHRDVKPSNLLATKRPDGSRLIKLLDFGIAKLGEHADDQRITGDSATLGSPAYMSPEQIRDAHSVDVRTDVWALGVLAQELFTGKPPFVAFTTSGVLASIIADDPAALPDHTPRALREAIGGCLVKDLDDRFQTVAEVAAALAPLLPEGAAIAERVRATLAGDGTRRDDAIPVTRAAVAETHDAPTYDPTEVSADEPGSSAPWEGASGRTASVSGTSSRDGVPAPPSAPRRRLPSPWIVPAIALPLGAALAFFASSRSGGSENVDRGIAAPATAVVPSASAAASAASAEGPPEETAATSTSPLPATPLPPPELSARSAPPRSGSTVPRRKAEGGATIARTAPTSTAAPPAQPPPTPTPPSGDDLDRFGGRK